MCRLIVWDMQQAPSTDARLQAGRYDRGMVVAVLEDGQDPGADVWKLGWWRVLDLPGVAVAEMKHLTAPQPENIDKALLPRKRAVVLDINTLPVPLSKAEPVIAARALIDTAQSSASYVLDTAVIAAPVG